MSYGPVVTDQPGSRLSPYSLNGVSPPGSTFVRTRASVTKGDLRALDQSQGTLLHVKFAGHEEKPSANLYLSGLPSPQVTEERLHQTFASLKIGLKRCKILPDDGRGHSCAMVEVESQEQAFIGIDMLNGQLFPASAAAFEHTSAVPSNTSAFTGDGGLVVRYAGKAEEPSANLYIAGLPSPETDEATLDAFFRNMSLHVVKSKVLRETQDASSCAAMIQLESTEQATVAIEALNGVPLTGSELATLVAQAPPPSSNRNVMEVRYAGYEEKPSPNIFISGLLAHEVDETLLCRIFAQHGVNVQRLQVLPATEGKSSSSALVQVASIEEAAWAIAQFNGQAFPENTNAEVPLQPEHHSHRIVGSPATGSDVGVPARHVMVRYAGAEQKPGSNLYITGLPLSVTQESLERLFTSLGTSVMRSKMIPDTRGFGYGCAMVELASHEQAASAIRTLSGKHFTDILESLPLGASPALSWSAANSGKTLLVARYAGKEETPSENLRVDGLPSQISEDRISGALFKLGFTVRKARVLADTHHGGPCACLVQLGSPEDAASLINVVNGRVAHELF